MWCLLFHALVFEMDYLLINASYLELDMVHESSGDSLYSCLYTCVSHALCYIVA